MNELALGRPATSVSGDEALEREFEEQLPEAATLAFRVAFGVLRQREDAQDVAQEAMAQAYRNFAKLQDRTRFRAWLVRVAWRLALNRRRDENRRVRREQAAPITPPSSVEELVATNEFQGRVWDAVDGLPDRLRLVVTLTAMEGREIKEAAALLEVPEGTVKSRLFPARRLLTERLRCLLSGTRRS
jgi:RNA polymerase sigma-70 factor (ECF subfamily)